MLIQPDLFARLDEYGARPYSGRAMFGAKCLGFTGLSHLLSAIRNVPELPITGWTWEVLGKDVVYYNPTVKLSQQIIDDYYED